jgi:XTP/dITP diphosphohydrolase
MIIILATNNKHKRDELVAVLQRELPDAFEIQTLEEAGLSTIEIEETGTTLEENALIKARTIHALTGSATLSDDTGLEVAALKGEPGVYSARYAGPRASYFDNVNKLLFSLIGEVDRRARFRTVIAYVDEQGSEHLFSGEVAGRITLEALGSNGFGYDPIFEPIEREGRTFAELSGEEKNVISHRARALREAARFLKERMKT